MSNTDEESSSLQVSPFEAIHRENEEGIEYWSARELAKILGYTEYNKFKRVIQKAEIACKNSDQVVLDHFAHVSDMIKTGKGAQRNVDDIHLSRYACYLVVQNADPTKEIVALGQTYFAVQTHLQEQLDQLADKDDNQRRLYLRNELTDRNRLLATTANQAGVVKAVDFAIFQDHGYMGLYGGLTSRDIHERKELKKSQKILDHMGGTELAANLFRATQAEDKIRREKIQGKEQANTTHYQVGKKVRQTIEELGGTMPEDLPTPKQSIQQLQTKEKKQLRQSLQRSLFDEKGHEQ